MLLSANIYAQENDAYQRLKNQANTYYYGGDFKRSAETLEAAIALKGENAGLIEVYNAACSWARAGNADKAFKYLNYLAGHLMADPQGAFGKDHLDPFTYRDKDFESLRKDPRWQKFLSRLTMKKTALANMLDTIYLDDQSGRNELGEPSKKEDIKALWERIHIQDSINLVKVKQILDSLGWPDVDSIGTRGSTALFLVIQHADLATQEQYLPMMRQAVKDRNARGSQLALLEDRVAMRKGKKQIYGSQVLKYGDGEWFLAAMIDPDHVDERRRTVGLPRLASYLKNWDIVWDVEEYKKQLPKIEKNMRDHGWGE